MIKQVTSCDYNFAIKLSNLENALFKNSWPPMMIYQKVNDGTFVYWIFLYEEKIIGYLAVHFLGDSIEILGIGVVKEHRRKKIASRLIENFLSYFENSDFRSITLEVRKSNSAAQKLYRQFGFTKVGERENYYKNEDAEVYIKEKLYVG
tara:strand:- start:31 stop:477 length:447 start_codon:yes stop_codon:yes gene_type:complete